jgi:predicted DCC family thiol-disulfide oxidoreductase YuxK
MTPGLWVIVFDGRCPLCRGAVRLLRDWARPGALRFAPALSGPGRALCRAHGLDPERLQAVLLVAGREHWLGSDAIWRAATRLRWPWRALAQIRWFPRSLRERVYGLIARRRPRRDPHQS